MIKTLGISLAIATIISMSGCGSSSSNDALPDNTSSGGDDSTGKMITGTVSGNGYAKNDIVNRFLNSIVTPLYALDNDSPDTIIVMYNGGESQKEFPINADGSFKIDTALLDKNDLVILVVNKAYKKVFGNLNLGTTSNAKLDFIDKSKLTGDLALGNIDTTSNCSTSATIQSVGSFSSTDATILEKIANADDAFVLSQNKYRNPDFNTEVFAWFNLGTISSVTEQFNDLTNFSKVNNFIKNSFGFSGDASWKTIDFKDVKIYPPSTVRYDTNFAKESTTTTPISARSKNLPSSNEADQNWAFFGFPEVNNFPTGDWIVKVNDVIKANFQFSGADAFDNNGKIKIPVPKVKINKDNSSIITSVEVQWYLYENGNYTEASEEMLNTLAGAKITGFQQFRLAKTDSTKYGFGHGEQVDTWNATYDFSGKNINISDISYITVSFGIGQANYKYSIKN